MLDDVRNPTHARGNDWEPGGHSLQENDAKGFEQRRKNEQVGGFVLPNHAGPWKLPHEFDGSSDPE